MKQENKATLKNGDKCKTKGFLNEVRYFAGVNPKCKTMCIVVDERGYSENIYLSDLEAL